MRSVFPRCAAASLALALAASALAQQPATAAPQAAAQPLDERCASCHGVDGTGSSRGPSIIPYLRYHTDAEVSAIIQQGAAHKNVTGLRISADDMVRLLT